MPKLNTLQEFPVLYTKSLILRKLNEADASSLYNYFSCDSEVSKYCDSFGPQSIDDAAIAIRNWNEQFVKKRFIRWGITLNDNDEVIGTVSASTSGKFTYSPVPSVEIGYDLSRRYWNKGIMTEVVSRVIEFLCDELNVIRIQATAHPQNIASKCILKRIGFEEEGLLRLYKYHTGIKEFQDRIIFSYINTGFKKNW